MGKRKREDSPARVRVEDFRKFYRQEIGVVSVPMLVGTRWVTLDLPPDIFDKGLGFALTLGVEEGAKVVPLFGRALGAEWVKRLGHR